MFTFVPCRLVEGLVSEESIDAYDHVGRWEVESEGRMLEVVWDIRVGWWWDRSSADESNPIAMLQNPVPKYSNRPIRDVTQANLKTTSWPVPHCR